MVRILDLCHILVPAIMKRGSSQDQNRGIEEVV